MRTQEVLCPTDFSATAAHALKYAVEMANLYQVDIRLLHVVSPARSAHFYGVAVETPATLEQQLAEFVEQKMQSLQQDMQQGLKSGLSIKPVIRHGDASEEILAEATDVGMVVIASHGSTSLMDFLKPHVSQDVVRLAKCPVLVVK
ncbi:MULTISPECIES: universal stress protein [unclassified Shewanella]|uniref:universal stress protein n=1 Tax=unclassified Shewanella TaxID=196818 RepID=UPI00244D1F46|nr:MULTISPECIES: universal stress protein [unclassified Shewanella]MDH0449827.1 universal stress protein [Shewanella sp. GD04112]MDH1471522.1 universal stress protein [Shewanella sp. GD03713]